MSYFPVCNHCPSNAFKKSSMVVVSLTVTVCPCNVRGNCRTAPKQLQGMPTIQSTVGILLGTLGVIGETRTQLVQNILKWLETEEDNTICSSCSHILCSCLQASYWLLYLWDCPSRIQHHQTKAARNECHLKALSNFWASQTIWSLQFWK